jgi:hypothetical protein
MLSVKQNFGVLYRSAEETRVIRASGTAEIDCDAYAWLLTFDADAEIGR